MAFPDGSQKDTISGRFLHEYLEIAKDFSDWIKVQIRRGNFIKGLDFCEVRKTPLSGGVSRGGRGNSVEYHFTRLAAERIGMMAGTDKGDLIRRKFQEYRDELVAIKSQRFDPLAVIRDPVKSAAFIAAAIGEVHRLEATVAAQAPKVEALDRIATPSNASMTLTVAAKTLQLHRDKLIDWMMDHKWLYRAARGKIVAMQTHLDRRHLEHKYYTPPKDNPEEKVYPQVFVTAKGLAVLAVEFSRKPKSHLLFD